MELPGALDGVCVCLPARARSQTAQGHVCWLRRPQQAYVPSLGCLKVKGSLALLHFNLLNGTSLNAIIFHLLVPYTQGSRQALPLSLSL